MGAMMGMRSIEQSEPVSTVLYEPPPVLLPSDSSLKKKIEKHSTERFIKQYNNCVNGDDCVNISLYRRYYAHTSLEHEVMTRLAKKYNMKLIYVDSFYNSSCYEFSFT